jgi:hypothetical protein
LIQQGPQLYLFGWACAKTHPGSIEVHLYAGGGAGAGGTLVGYATANQSSEPAVANACNATGSNYRFMIAIAPCVQQLFAGQRIYAYGLSPFPELPNLVIANSGVLTIPALD